MRIGDGVAWTVSPTRVVAMDLSQPGANPLVLEASAAIVWEEIAAEGSIAPDDLLRTIATAFDVEADSIRESIDVLLTDLIARALLVRGGND